MEDEFSGEAHNARINLPDGWESRPLTDAQKLDRMVLFAHNKTTDTSLILASSKRSGITDMQTYAKSRRANQASRIQDAQSSEIVQLVINDLPAWRYEVTGKAKNGTSVTFNSTIFESDQEVVLVTIGATAVAFEQNKESLLKIVDSLTGLPPPFDPVKAAEAKKKAAEGEASNLAVAEEAKRLAADEEEKRIAAVDEARRVAAAEEEAKSAKTEATRKAGNQVPYQKPAPLSQQLDFNIEANKAARILGCQPLEVKVTGVDGGNIQYLVACNGSKSLLLSCDPSGLCLQKKSVASSKR